MAKKWLDSIEKQKRRSHVCDRQTDIQTYIQTESTKKVIDTYTRRGDQKRYPSGDNQIAWGTDKTPSSSSCDKTPFKVNYFRFSVNIATQKTDQQFTMYFTYLHYITQKLPKES